ncbi:MAG: aldo/keto reductase [Myxococcota bacterium]|nr:aldo/keto reductase [Myxococcota bacterium]MDW8362589.1 aldo/keto reductase [Myxococcales bacterium]
MNRRPLGGTDLRVCEIALGTMGLATEMYGPVEPTRLERVVEHALDLGVGTFDVAPLWGGGRAEEVVGRAVAKRGEAAQIVTRAGAVLEGGRLVHRFEPDALVADVEASLRRLGVACVDVVLLHDPPAHVLGREEVPAAMDGLVQAGKARCWGVSTATILGARTALAVGARVLCIPYSLLQPSPLTEIGDEVQRAGAGVLVRSPLCHGLLAGRFNEARQFDPSDHRRDRWSQLTLGTRVRQVDRLRFLVHDRVQSMAEAAVRFVLANALVACCIVGARTSAQLTELVRAADGPPYLPDADMRRLSDVLREIGIR